MSRFHAGRVCLVIFKYTFSISFLYSVLLTLLMTNPNAFANTLDNETEWSTKSGTLLICGGGDLPDVIFDRFLELAGGSQARLVVIPTARVKTEHMDSSGVYAEWQDRGAASVAVLHTVSRQEADSDAFVEPLRQATGVWFTGGSQSHMASIYVGTVVERELHALLARGGVIAGTSAGAAIQSRTMIARGNPDAEIEVGFDLLPNSVIDQHFRTRNRKQRLVRVIQENSGLIGFGIDEGTALIVAGTRLQVVGESTVTVFLAAAATQPAEEIELGAGDVTDLTALQRAAHRRAEAASKQAADFKR